MDLERPLIYDSQRRSAASRNGYTGRDWERYRKANEMRLAGKTYKAIGDALGVSATRASQMIEYCKRMEKRGDLRVLPRHGVEMDPRS